jgi:ATPase subunit of ABC transporter with duplicated ATPase domains
MLIARGLTVEIDAKTIVDDVDVQVAAGEKVGLVGRNGAGKTTLLRALSGAETPKAGLVRRPTATGYLAQDPRSDGVADDTTGLAHVLEGHGVARLQDQLEKARIGLEEDSSTANVNHYSHLHERFEAAGGYAAEAEVRRLAAGVGLAPDRLDLPLGGL